MTDQSFVHLHVHTEFSLLDGFSRIEKLTERAAELGMPALAITDHGTMFGVMDFYDAAQKRGIKPVIGFEAYLAERGMEDRDPQRDRKPYHMLLLAENQTGYLNLLKLSSEAQIRGYYYRPRIDWDLLAQHSEGVIATSTCLAAMIPRMIEQGRDDEAREWIGRFAELFGEDRFYLELQDHDIDQQKALNRWLIDYRRSGHTNVGLLATTDLHYVEERDYDFHDTLLCIQTGAQKSDSNRMRFTDNTYYMYSQQQMWGIFGDEVPEALHNSVKIAEMCQVDLDRKGYHLPRFPVPEGFDAQTYLRHLCEIGMDWRYGERRDEPELRDRLDRELDIIHDMGFDTYFLIVWDLCEFARHADIWWNVRGSGAGSLAAYCLGITNIDPILNNLLFERFLNPGRVSMPDIDLDYPDDRRGEMISYAARKYGEDKVAAIITFGTLGAKNAVRDVARAMGVELADVNRAVAHIPQEAKVKPLMTYVDTIPDLKRIYEREPQIRQVFDTAKELQGVARHASTHAAGVIISDKPLVEYLPLHRVTGKDPSGGSLQAVTQFPMETCESIGLLKVDFLGLSTLTILRKACELVERHHGIRYTMDNIPYRHDDERLTEAQRQMLDDAFEMMGRGETVGVFQLESTGMQQMLRGMRPKTFENIVAGISLYRPGPMEFIPQYNRRLHGEEETQYRHPKLEPILKETFGIMVYQEQLMQIGGQLFGYDLGEADLMRRAVSKKKKEALAEHRAIFLERGPQNGIDEEAAGQIFDDIEFFANYGFNKCVVGSTEIIDADTGRRITVEDLFTGRETITHTVTCDTNTLRLQPGLITDVMANGVKPVYTLTTQTGRRITATANHPFYTFHGWRNLGDLQIGEKVAVTTAPYPLNPFAPYTGKGDFIPRQREVSDLRGTSPQRSNVPNRHETTLQDALAPVFTEGSSQGHQPHNDIYWDTIVSIEYAGEQATYDLTIDGTHNFVANDIIVHNSHASDYAVITVQTAFLKCHYKEEYMAALLTVQHGDSAKVATFLEESRRLQIPILPPDVNTSLLDFDIQPDPDTGKRGIRFGLAAVKNAGENALRVIITARDEGGLFRDLEDFCQRVDLREVGKRTVESLIKVGALVAFGNRATLLQGLDRIMAFSAKYHKDKAAGQMNMFGEMSNGSEDLLTNLPPAQEPGRREMLGWEKELLGLYVTGRPVDRYREALHARGNTATIFDLKENMAAHKDRQIAVAGEVVAVRIIYTNKDNKKMAVIQLEDWHESAASIEIVFFPRTWASIEQQIEEGVLQPLEEGPVILVGGKFDIGRGDPQIIGESVTTNFDVMEAAFDHLPQDNAPPAWLTDGPAPRDEQAPPWLDDPDLYDEETGEIAHDETVPEPATPDVIVSPSQGAVGVPTPSIEPQFTASDSDSPNGNGFHADEGEPLPWAGPPSDPTLDLDDLQPVDLTRSDDPRLPTHRIDVFFPRSGNDDSDRRRLRRLHGLLVKYPGNDRFRIIINPVTADDERQIFDFPNHSTGLCDDLMQDLLSIVSTENNIRIVENAE